MVTPYAHSAVVDIRKLTGYLLNPKRKTGRNKARMFRAALGLTSDNAEVLRTGLLEAVRTNDAKLGLLDHYGQRYTVDFAFEWNNRRAIIRSGWLIEHGTNVPRLTTAYPI